MMPKTAGAGRPQEASVPVVDEAVTDVAGVAGVLGVLGMEAGLIGERGHLSLGLEVSTEDVEEAGEKIGDTVLLR